jgi:hypothetical protein
VVAITSLVTLALGSPAPVFAAAAPYLSVVHPGGSEPLFSAEDRMTPGWVQSRSVTVSRHGGPADEVGLYVTSFNPRSPESSHLCTAPDPADRVNLTINTRQETVYEGTLSDFARRHASAESALRLHHVTTEVVTFTVGLHSSAGNSYMGCRSTANLTWRLE